MKKIKILKTLLVPAIGITAIGTIVAVSTSCSPVVLVTGVSLDKKSLTLDVGGSDTLIATVHPDDATDESVTWRSSDSGVATVDNNGNVTAVGEGQAIITITTNDGGLTDTCQVTVNQKIIHVTNVTLNKASTTLNVGDIETLTATVLPTDATDKSVTWSSSNSNVATVDNNGKVTAVSEGSAKIKVKTNDGGHTTTCQITVNQQIIHATGVSLNKDSLTLDEGGSETLTATVLPADATDKSVTWSSSNSNVATVDNNGKVTAVSEGSAKITVKTNDGGYEDYCDVTVTYVAASYICVTANADSTLELRNEGENNPNLQYSDDLKIWHDYSGTISIPAGSIYYLKGNNPTGWSQGEQTYSHFNITGNVSISGNVMALLDNGTGTISSIPNDYCFYALFTNSAGITSVSEDFIPATTLKTRCYSHMFISCSSLTTAPTLPATTLAESCYHSMFAYCTTLTTVPGLSATTLAKDCCRYMFDACTSLTTAPTLPATTLAQDCYSSMFEQCTSLTTAPDLPATTLAHGCYSDMFNHCISLTTAPDLPAKTLENNCYQGMFYNCLSLTSAPALPATTLANSCYAHMFCDCTSLKTATYLPATTLASNCYQGMFSNCSSLTNAPLVLPATTLSSYCYYGMFANCTSLTTAPDLPATTLAVYCYEHMFYECTNLSSIRLGYTGTPYATYHAFTVWVYNVSANGTFYYTGTDTDPIKDFILPSGWTHEPY